MVVMTFEGVSFAKRIESELEKRVLEMGRKPRLVIFWVGDNQSSEKYVAKKKELGERIGIEVVVERVEVAKLESGIRKVVSEADGVMVQLPIPGMSRDEAQKVIDLIPIEKDVDGLTGENLKLIATGEQEHLPATVKAVGKIMDEAIRETELDIEKMKVAVVGSRGVVGQPLVSQLKRFGFEIGEFDEGDELKLSDFDVVISATGREGLIKPEMVKDGVVGIDVGFPKGDFDPAVEKKAGFFTPVPGGVGPVTVVCLFENLLQ